MTDIDIKTELLESSISKTLETDCKLGLGVDKYERLLKNILDFYGVIGEIKFVYFKDEEAVVLYIEDRRWYMRYCKSLLEGVSYIVRHIEILDQLGYAKPYGDHVVDYKRGVKLFNLEDLKLNPTSWIADH